MFADILIFQGLMVIGGGEWVGYSGNRIDNAFHLTMFGGIPYTDHGAKITAPPLIFYFCLYAYFSIGQVKIMFAPQGQERVQLGPHRVRAPRGARIRRKKLKIKNRGGGFCSPSAKHGKAPNNSFSFQIYVYMFPHFWYPIKNILMSWCTYLIMGIATERYLAVCR